MKTWSKEEIELLNEAFWAGKPANCPLCGAIVDVRPSKEVRPVPRMMARCPGCEASAKFEAAEATGEDFTAAQVDGWAQLKLRGVDSFCPHDGARLRVKLTPTLGPVTWIFVSCPRCGAHGESKIESQRDR